jgi:hypothetical protein
MPSRVLQVMHIGERLYLQLCDTNFGTPEPYVALSYKWGGDQPVKTTNKSIYRHMVGIPMGDLPGTVRDAVLIAEKLGI